MSAAGRGVRSGGPDDCYPTPGWCVARLLDAWQPPAGTLLEPGAGDGAIIRAVTEGPLGARRWIAVESRATNEPALVPVAAKVAIADYLTWTPSDEDEGVAAAIGNPPYSLAEKFIRRTRILFPAAPIAFLLRIAFLSSKERVPLWRDVGTPDVFALPNRPSFTSNGRTDGADYAWMVLPPQPREEGRVRVLSLTPLEVRRPGGRSKRRRKA